MSRSARVAITSVLVVLGVVLAGLGWAGVTAYRVLDSGGPDWRAADCGEVYERVGFAPPGPAESVRCARDVFGRDSPFAGTFTVPRVEFHRWLREAHGLDGLSRPYEVAFFHAAPGTGPVPDGVLDRPPPAHARLVTSGPLQAHEMPDGHRLITLTVTAEVTDPARATVHWWGWQ
ncbi:hypothetical protein PJ985_06525 [Streptomyces sp. ACA25]|uniref:hypothetical protein n=1 Tax=Streptomyces sp. ACA25 TaxID=3022596 RepID=UPI00230758DD|nr:hypothetical protein [Streptomyces sp. ACA25]MDB1087222.1 hypothetical protein [Streptomyces sp. ACA25]